MTLLGMPFEKAAYSFGWGNLRDFAGNLPQASATYRAINSDMARFGSPIKQSAILADVYDAVTALAYMFAKAHGGKGQKPKPYPRPGDKDTQRLGSDPIPISKFNEWYYGGE